MTDEPILSKDLEQLLDHHPELRRRLEEAEDLVRALRAGEVDAVFVEGEREQIYTLETADKPYRMLVEQLPRAAATLTSEGSIIYCNRRFVDLLHRPLHDLVGKRLDSFVRSDCRAQLAELWSDCKAGEIVRVISLERGERSSVQAYLSARVLEQGALGQCILVTDITEQKHYEELEKTQKALQAATERLELAQKAGRIGTFEWDIQTGVIRWSVVSEELFGFRPGTFDGTFEATKRIIHPDDRERVEKALAAAVKDATELEIEFRTFRPDRAIRWIVTRGKVIADSARGTLRMVGVHQDITERKRVVEQLRLADRNKDHFLATLAHELRNPLAPIRNATEILKFKGLEDPDMRAAQAIIDRQVGVMTRLLDDLLDVSRIARHRLELRKEPVELAGVLDSAVETSRPLIEARRHELTMMLPPDSIYLEADSVRLAQVFSNLLNNAAKYTREGGNIWLEAHRDGSEVVVSVRDDGIGIPPEILPEIFEMFLQAQPSTGPEGGLGIGLSLVKNLVKLHGGSTEARSEGRDRGSEFIVRLPVMDTVASPKMVPNPATHSEGLRVLIVDDNRDGADSLAKLMAVMGHTTDTAYDGEQGVEEAERLRPDVVLLDLGLPKLNGYEACRRIRQQPWGKEMVVIAVTGWGKDTDRQRSREAGFAAHLVKPVDPQVLGTFLSKISKGSLR
jgi:PAS domain S-box-containing protein